MPQCCVILSPLPADIARAMIGTKLLNRVTGITRIRGRHGIEVNLKGRMFALVKLIYMNATRLLHASNLSNAIRYA